MPDLKNQLIRLGSTNPELQPHIRKILANLNFKVELFEDGDLVSTGTAQELLDDNDGDSHVRKSLNKLKRKGDSTNMGGGAGSDFKVVRTSSGKTSSARSFKEGLEGLNNSVRALKGASIELHTKAYGSNPWHGRDDSTLKIIPQSERNDAKKTYIKMENAMEKITLGIKELASLEREYMVRIASSKTSNLRSHGQSGGSPKTPQQKQLAKEVLNALERRGLWDSLGWEYWSQSGGGVDPVASVGYSAYMGSKPLTISVDEEGYASASVGSARKEFADANQAATWLGRKMVMA